MKLINKADLKLMEDLARICKKKRIRIFFGTGSEFEVALLRDINDSGKQNKMINKVDLKIIENVAELCKKKALFVTFGRKGRFTITFLKEEDNFFADELRKIIKNK